MGDVVYLCHLCRRVIGREDLAIQAMTVAYARGMSGKFVQQITRGEWFHAGCWTGLPPYREIDRGTLAEVLARA